MHAWVYSMVASFKEHLGEQMLYGGHNISVSNNKTLSHNFNETFTVQLKFITPGYMHAQSVISSTRYLHQS